MPCLLAIPAQAMAYNPLTLVYEANNLRVGSPATSPATTTRT